MNIITGHKLYNLWSEISWIRKKSPIKYKVKLNKILKIFFKNRVKVAKTTFHYFIKKIFLKKPLNLDVEQDYEYELIIIYPKGFIRMQI